MARRVSAGALLTIGLAFGCSGTTTTGLMHCSASTPCGADSFCTGGSCYPKLAAGGCATTSEHAASDVCTSGVCLGGACCSAACPAADSSCAATSCDPSAGSCVYPTSTVACGPPETCVNGSHTAASSCNGQGTCSLSQAAPCATNACADGQRCVVACTDASACTTSQYCAAGQCTDKVAAGAVCATTSTSTSDSACTSNNCLGGRCCSTLCSIGDATCGATGCDPNGACVYPSNLTPCGALHSCMNSFFTPNSACNGQGLCAPPTPVSCEPYACNVAGGICSTSCTQGGSECAADGYCKSQKCASKGGPGAPCVESSTSDANQSCLSSICEVNCCVTDCPPDVATNNCGGTCSATGSCVAVQCPSHFGCSGTATCNTQCAVNMDCDTQSFCDTTGSTGCCGRFSAGDTVYVDATLGGDAVPCCGTQAAPCQTLTRAMALVASSATSGVIIQAQTGDAGPSWTANETYPIHLGWGVTLHAPSVFFANQANASEIFKVYAYGPTDTGTVTIEGGPGGMTTDAVHIGFDPQLVLFRDSIVAVDDDVAGQTALPMTLSNVWLAGSYSGANAPRSSALDVGAGATVTLGPGQVYIGNGDLYLGSVGNPNRAIGAWHGIFCEGVGATIQDDPTASAPVLAISSTNESYMDVEDGCTVTLTQGPIFGTAFQVPKDWDGTLAGCPLTDPSDGFCYWDCDAYPSTAVQVVGNAAVSLGSLANPAMINCASIGTDEETSDTTGSPTVVLNGAVVDLEDSYTCNYGNNPPSCDVYVASSCAGAVVMEGSFSATATTFRHSYMGVFAGGDAGKVDLSGDGNGGNTFECVGVSWSDDNFNFNCSTAVANIAPSAGGASVVNASASIGINAENGAWNDYDSSSGMTQVWSCSDTTYTDCVCVGPNCSDAGVPEDGADAIYVNTNTAATPIDSSMGSQGAAFACYPPATPIVL
jgi:hypothetical protein